MTHSMRQIIDTVAEGLATRATSSTPTQQEIREMANWHGVDRSELSKKKQKPFIDAHVVGDVAEVELLYVPPNERGKGVAKRLYQRWEKSLPKNVEFVQLEAVDYGDGAGMSNLFWERMGFVYKYDVSEESNVPDEIAYRMWKGVNGHPTPPPTVLERDGDEDD